MQRMKLHTSGVKVTKLGSLHDRVIRKYLTKEAELEAKALEFSMLVALTNPNAPDDAKRRSWVQTIQNSWNSYLGKLFTVDIPESTPEEDALLEYYKTRVSKMKLSIRQSKKGLHLEGFDANDL